MSNQDFTYTKEEIGAQAKLVDKLKAELALEENTLWAMRRKSNGNAAVVDSGSTELRECPNRHGSLYITSKQINGVQHHACNLCGVQWVYSIVDKNQDGITTLRGVRSTSTEVR